MQWPAQDWWYQANTVAVGMEQSGWGVPDRLWRWNQKYLPNGLAVETGRNQGSLQGSSLSVGD